MVVDQPSVAQLLESLLRADGHAVHIVSPEAFSLSGVAKLEAAALLFDPATLPGEGWSLPALSRSVSATSTLPMLVCTGDGEQVRLHHSVLAQPGVDLLIKPIDPVELHRSLNRLLAARIAASADSEVLLRAS